MGSPDGWGLTLARHYGFKVDPAPPRDPVKKGKVEAGLKYVKNNFFKTVDERSPIDDVNRQLLAWVMKVAGERDHGTTHRRPVVVFEAEEKPALTPLAKMAFVPAIWKQAKVHRDSHVVFDKRLYSVPWKHIGAQVWLRATPESVTIYVDDERVRTHDRRAKGPWSTVEADLPAHRADLAHRGTDYWIKRAAAVGDEVGGLIHDIVRASDELSPLRVIQGIVTHFEQFPRDRANNAARRARHFGTHDYRGVRDILRKALDYEPLPPTLLDPPAPAAPVASQYARSFEQFSPSNQETTHGIN